MGFSLRGAAPRWWMLLATLTALSALVYLGSDDGNPDDRTIRFSGQTMGTSYRVVLGKPQTRAAQTALRDAVDALLLDINASMSTYDPDSEVSRFNRHASTEPFEVSAQLADVVRMGLEVGRASEGAFDITVGPLVDAWGFGPHARPAHTLNDADVAKLRARVGYTKLSLEGTRLRKAHPALQIDLSGIAKGHGVDQVALLLERHGHHDYLVEIGGELRGRGRNAQGLPFRVGIEEPLADRRTARTSVALGEMSIATSGDYRNQFELDGEHFTHAIDPATGRPVRHRLMSASVLHATCALADAWATALLVAGPDKALQLAQAAELDVLLLVAGEDDAVIEHATGRFRAQRLDKAVHVAQGS